MAKKGTRSKRRKHRAASRKASTIAVDRYGPKYSSTTAKKHAKLIYKRK